MIIASDLRSESRDGHITQFPGSDVTVIAQWPAEGNVAPPHVVLYEGACGMGEMVGL